MKPAYQQLHDAAEKVHHLASRVWNESMAQPEGLEDRTRTACMELFAIVRRINAIADDLATVDRIHVKWESQEANHAQ